ncbi:MAG: MgtC/SapB family protein [Sedimentisphaerales bacterium]|nr:MgtC/SapB family protein [Sedimentisphaerales bacterium]
MVWPEDLLSIILATVLGAVIGLERELSGKAAGLRTNLLICLGAAVFTIISRQMAVDTTGSITRIAAQIVTGVGFLGAGAIIQDRGGVHGLTTAATIWLVSSIGMACGARFYQLAIITTIIAIVVLIGLAKLPLPLEHQRKKTTRTTAQKNEDNESAAL